MARSRLDLRREAEAVEARKKAGGGDEAAEKPKKARATKTPAKRATRSKAKAAQRKRLLWGVFSGSMKEEARFPFDQRAAAEERLELLRSKSKKLYFIQPIKEVIGEGAAPAKATAAPADFDDDAETAAAVPEGDEADADDAEPEEMELEEDADEAEDDEEDAGGGDDE